MTRAGHRLRALWCAWWFRRGSLLDLGIARVVLALIVLELNGVMRFWSVGLVSPDLWKPLPWIAALGFHQPPTLRALVLYGRVTQAALVAVAVGFLTPLALWTALLLQLLQEGFLNCFGKTGHGTIPLLYAMLFFALSPCGRAISVDALLGRAWRRMRGAPSAPARSSIHAQWPFELLFVELATYYFLAGYAKVANAGLSWADGYTLQFYLLEKATPAGLWLAEWPVLCAVLSALVLAFELSWPVAIVVRRLRPLLFAGGVAFHLGTIVLLRISFWPVWVLYVLFIPWSALLARLFGGPAETRLSPVRTAAMAAPLTSRTPDLHV